MKRKDRDSDDPKSVVRELLKEFPNIASDLKQLLELIDGGKAVDITGIAHKSLIKPLTSLFLSLHLNQLHSGAFVLPPHAPPTLELIGFMVAPPVHGDDDVACPQRRPIGPEMPTPELLAAAAKLREAEIELRAAESEEKDARLGSIGPAPRARVEADSTKLGDGFKEVTRIMGEEDDSVYGILSMDCNVTADNIKRRYLKLSLLVHPDKCSHSQASQAFVKLNKAFKELQDPEKRRTLDERIQRMSGRREGGVKPARKRDEWMTDLPPERKNCSGWNDGSSERARKAKMDYLQAYNEFMSLSLSEEERKRSLEAELMVDRYNKEKRPKSLSEKHKEEIRARRLKRKHSKQEVEEEDWVGKHPWKPWDRDKDLAGSRKSVKPDLDNMTQGLSSRFSRGSCQRNFL